MELHNDGSGLGFGIVGGRTTGVIIKTILPGGVADRVRSLRHNHLIIFYISVQFVHHFSNFLVNKLLFSQIVTDKYCTCMVKQKINENIN